MCPLGLFIPLHIEAKLRKSDYPWESMHMNNWTHIIWDGRSYHLSMTSLKGAFSLIAYPYHDGCIPSFEKCTSVSPKKYSIYNHGYQNKMWISNVNMYTYSVCTWQSRPGDSNIQLCLVNCLNAYHTSGGFQYPFWYISPIFLWKVMTALWSLLLHSVVNCLAVEVKQCIPFSGLFRILRIILAAQG